MPNFALPGLMEISRPVLDAQRTYLELLAHRIQDSKWAGIPSVGPVRPGGAQPAWPLARVEMVFGLQLPVEDASVFIISSAPTAGQGTLTIDDATTWSFSVPEQALPEVMDLGLYWWEIRTTDTQGTVTVFYVGKLLITS